MWSILSEVYVVIGISCIVLYISYYFEGTSLVRVNYWSVCEKKVVWQVIQVMLFAGLLSSGVNESMEGNVLFNDSIEVSGLVKYGTSLVYVFGGLCLIGVVSNMDGESSGKGANGSVIVLLCVFGLSLLISSKEWLSVYLCLELQSLGFYVLATISSGSGRGTNNLSSFGTESGVKYFIIGGLGSGLFLFGSSCIYGATGTMRFDELSWLCWEGEDMWLLRVGMVFVIGGVLFKMSAAPFHMWIVDVIEGASNRTARLFSVVPKLGILCVLVKVLSVLNGWEELIMLAAGLSMVLSVCGAFYQRKVKRFLGYSGIGHMGYMLMGVCVGGVGLNSALSYMCIYMLMGYCVWELVERKGIVWIEELGSVGKENRVIGGSVCVLLLSMAGVPPFGGFFVKVRIFSSVLDGGMYVLALIGVLCTVLGTFNYLRWLKVIYFDKEVKSVGRKSSVGDGAMVSYENDWVSVLMGSGLLILTVYGMLE